MTCAELNNAIATTARNLNTALPVSDPPTQAEVHALMDKINEIIAAGSRLALGKNRKQNRLRRRAER